MEDIFNLNSIIYKKQGDKKGKVPYQDRMNAKTFDDGTSIVVLADGLGSKSKSHIGAEIAVKTSIKTLYKLFENYDGGNLTADTVRTTLLSEIKREIKERAKDDNINDYREYACTLLFAIMKQNSIALGQIGDGYIVIKKPNEEPRLVFDPKDENSEFGNATRTVFDNPRHMQLSLGKRKDIEYLFLSSDGTDKLRRNNFKGEYTPFITGKALGRRPQLPIFNFMEQLLKDSKACSIKPVQYPKDLTATISSMLLNNVVDDDVTFAFVNPNIEGPTRRLTELLDVLNRSQDMEFDR